MSRTQALADAIALAQRFATTPAEPDDWPGIVRGALSMQLVKRINDPDLVHQVDTSLCGPAAFVRAVAMDMPLNYARCVIDLYRTGAGNIVGLDIAPRRRMRRTPPKMGTHGADWIMLGGVRDDENLIFSVAQAPGLVAGMTLPRTMVKWFKSAGYSNVSDQAHIGWWPLEHRLATARYASNLHSGGYRVVMLIDADVLYVGRQYTDKINVPNHWVTLKEPIFSTPNVTLEDDVSFRVHSWGGSVQVAGTTPVPLSLRKFLQKFYGFVAAKL